MQKSMQILGRVRQKKKNHILGDLRNSLNLRIIMSLI